LNIQTNILFFLFSISYLIKKVSLLSQIELYFSWVTPWRHPLNFCLYKCQISLRSPNQPTEKPQNSICILFKRISVTPVTHWIFSYLHCTTKAPSSAASSKATGSRPCRTSCLTCRKSWYLQMTNFISQEDKKQKPDNKPDKKQLTSGQTEIWA